MERIKVWAPAGEPPVQYRNERGEAVAGRFVARGPAPDHAPLPEGEEVPATVEIRRDIARGHLVTDPTGAHAAPGDAPRHNTWPAPGGDR